MKLVLGTTLVLLLAGAPCDRRQESDKDKPQEEPRRQEEPKKGKQDQEKSKPQEKPKQEPDRQQQDRARPGQQNDRAQQQQQGDRNRNQQPKPAQQQDRAQEHQRAQQTQQHSDRGNARRVPDQQYRASFGREHHFHIQRNDNRRFQYGGYYFQYSEPWPSDWDYNDDVYIEDDDGEYYLFNPHHSGVRLLVAIGD